MNELFEVLDRALRCFVVVSIPATAVVGTVALLMGDRSLAVEFLAVALVCFVVLRLWRRFMNYE